MNLSIRAAFAGTLFALLTSICAAADHGRTVGHSSVSPSGAATYSIPMWTPPGPNGVQPSLGLSYNSNAGNGLAGVGWNVSVGSSISRCPRTLHQDGDAAAIAMTLADRFCIDGNRLRLSSGSYGVAGSVYFTEIADYSRITAYGTWGSGPEYFIVEAKNGLRYEYGNTADSREAPGGSTVLRWLLNKVSDRNGNNYVLAFTNAAGTRIPDTIKWTPTSLYASTYRYEAKFNYDTNRIDLDSSFTGTAGYILINRGRLNNVQIKSAGVVVRKYLLSYDTSSVTSRSLLSSVTECADDSQGDGNCFLPIDFTYQPGMAGVTAGAGTAPASGNGGVYAGRYDFNGDGKDDIAYWVGSTLWVAMGANNGFTAASNTGIGGVIDRFLPNGRDAVAGIGSGTLRVAYWDDASSSFLVHNTGIATTTLGMGVDYNGDGLADLVTKHSNSLSLQVRKNTSEATGSLSFSNTLTTTALLSGSSWWRYTGILSASTGLDHIDLNGDGREDLNAMVIWTNDNPPAEGDVARVTLLGTSSGYQLPAISHWEFYPVGEALSLHFNGDACTDRFVNNTVQIAPCNDSWGSTISAPATPQLLMDWDGDGKTDILANNGSTFSVYRSTGNGFSDPFSTSISSTGTIFDADVDGDGMDDLVRLNGSSAISYWTHTAGGAVPTYATNIPDLLESATDGFGVSTIFNHVSTAWSNYDKGTATTYPLQENGPHIVVARATSSNGIGGTFNRDYSYTGARRHAGRRTSLGFQRFDSIDSRNGLISRTDFEQEFPKSGMVKQSELLQPNGTTAISRTVLTNSAEPLDSTANNQRHFIYPSASTTTQFEAEGDWNGLLLRTVVTENTFDFASGALYDQRVTTTEPASGANGIHAGGEWKARTYMPLANLLNDTANWCLGRPQLTQQINSNNLTYGTSITRSTSTTWNATYCRPTQIIDEPGSGTLQVTTDIGYDSFGNINSATVAGAGMDARTTSAVYSDGTHTTGQFPLSVTNALGQTSTTEWNYDFGLPDSVADPNGISTSWEYDDFGRRFFETRPDGTMTEWTPAACSSGCGVIKTILGVIEYASDGSTVANSNRFLDQFDREQWAHQWLADAAKYQVTWREFNALGQVAKECFPYQHTDPVPGHVSFTYDLLGRPKAISRPVSASISSPQTTTIHYEGLKTRVVDAQGTQTGRVMNAAGQIASSADNDGYSQSFGYDAFGNLKRVWDGANTLQSSNFNDRGMMTSRTDMDMGSWGFTPNALGEVVSQTDAKGQTTSFEFDLLGRLKKRIEPDGTSEWTWGVLADNTASSKYVGRLKEMEAPGYGETYAYDSIARPSSTTISADITYQVAYSYNNQGALDTLTYPASTGALPLKVKFGYTHGHLTQVRECVNTACNQFGAAYWTASTFNARNQLTQETLGNGQTTTRDYDAITGWLKTIETGPNAAIQDLAYEWDLVGNLKKRTDHNQSGLYEEFFYDNLYRLDYSMLNGGPNRNIDLAYDLLGNIDTKSDVGSYIYHSTRKHQVTSAGGMSLGYDANGNVTSRGGTTLEWTSYNYPKCIRTGADCSGTSSNWSSFSYTPDRQYWKQVSNYISGGESATFYIGGLLEKVQNISGTDFRHLIRAGSATIIVSRKSSGADSVHYVTSDHLGSSSTVSGTTLNASFDAFGRRRGAAWTGTPSSGDWSAIASTTRRGYTEHSMLDNLELIHMNGRVQDPVLGRFLSADPYIPDPLSTQSYNRYSYVQNNPLSFIDPSGFFDAQVRPDPLDGWREPPTCNFSYNFSPCLHFFDDECSAGRCVLAQSSTLSLGSTTADAERDWANRTLGYINEYIKGGADSFLRSNWESPQFDNIGGAHPSFAELYGPYQSPFAAPKTSEDELARDLGATASVLAALALRRFPSAHPSIGVERVTAPIGDLRAAGLKDAHHVVQDAAVRNLPGYNTQLAPGVQLPGPSTAVGTPHYSATQVQRQAGGGTLAAELRIGYKALRRAGFSETQARQAIAETEAFFRSIGLPPTTVTRVPGNR